MTITLKIENLRSTDPVPCYCKYRSQINPQDAYVEIDEDGEVSASYSGEIGNAVPGDVWHRRTIRVPVAAAVLGEALADMLESDEAMALLERIHAGHTVTWDGNNHAGKTDEDADAAIDALERLLETVEQAEVGDPDWYIASCSLADCWAAGRTLAEAAEDLVADAAANGVVLDGDAEDALIAKARDAIERGDEVTAEQRDAVDAA